MKNKLVLLIFLAILFAGFVGVRFFLLNSQDVFGQIRVVTSPSSTVFINNVAVGKTPYEEKIKMGQYLIKLIPEATASQTASWQGKVNVYKSSLSYIYRDLGDSDISSSGEILTVTKMEKTTNANYGEFYVETEPSGAIVYLDNDEKGVSPLILADVVKGDHELSAFMPGFLRRTEKVRVESGYRVNANFKLAIDPNQQQKISDNTDNKNSTASATASDSAKPKKTMVVVKDSVKETSLGALRVREEPTVSASESAQVQAGDKFDLLDEQAGWYKIEYKKNSQGWIYSQYADKVEQ